MAWSWPKTSLLWLATRNLSPPSTPSRNLFNAARRPQQRPEADDGTLEASGWVAAGDDFLVSGNLSGVLMGESWTTLLAVLSPGAGTGTFWGLADGATTDSHVAVRLASSGLALVNSWQTPSGLNSGNLTIPTNAIICLSVVSDGANIVMTRLDLGTTVTVVNNVTSTAAARVGLGAIPRSDYAAKIASATIPFHAFHNRALSAAEIQRAYADIKARMLAKGITVL